MAITAWSANVWTSSISEAENARTSCRDTASTPIAAPSRCRGTCSRVRAAMPPVGDVGNSARTSSVSVFSM